ncbi:hypothetical protein AQUCO_02700013v1 [Aquilegia coerulea]|uniref:Thioredoxin domain-containing protein n=1 Tax=Aquilegia coerulea TaxID=218851 RepID=A0A2G5D4S4_AQUCA|nr:hypothetical protein AQUCO_02700013v1 [Aquilegia coerulea]
MLVTRSKVISFCSLSLSLSFSPAVFVFCFSFFVSSFLVLGFILLIFRFQLDSSDYCNFNPFEGVAVFLSKFDSSSLNGKLRRQDEGDHPINFGGGNVQLVTTKEGWDEKLSEASRLGKIVVANFSATWCGPCRIIAQLYSELSEKYPSLMFLAVDVDELTEFSSSWDIRATPTFFFLRDGKQIDKLVGANKPELQKKIVTFADTVARSK